MKLLEHAVIAGMPVRNRILRSATWEALADAKEAGIKGKATTPFLLAKIVELTGGDSLKTNIQLAYNNARCAAQIAVELSKLG